MVNMAPDTLFDNGSNPGQLSEDPRYVEYQLLLYVNSKDTAF